MKAHHLAVDRLDLIPRNIPASAGGEGRANGRFGIGSGVYLRWDQIIARARAYAHARTHRRDIVREFK